MNELPKNPAEFFKMMQEHMPKVQPTQNGYEIRAKILELAQQQALNDFHFKFGDFAVKTETDGNETVTTVDYPGADQVLEIANKFNDFVSTGKTSK